MKKVLGVSIAAIVHGVASLGLVAQPVGAAAAPPPPEAVQAWYKAQPKERKALPPEGSLTSLNLLYSLMFDYKANDDDKRFDSGKEGSKQVDRFRKVLTHSPDRKLNGAMGKALDCAGDAFDNIGFDGQKAVDRCEGQWAKVEATLKLYGVDTGAAWALGGAPPPPPPPPASVTYDLTGQGTVSVTLQNESGGTEQFDTPLPYHRDLGGVSGFVYISAQLNNTGTVTCEIKQGDTVIQNATSSGQYVIATCSGAA
jgi:hypothetical protein